MTEKERKQLFIINEISLKFKQKLSFFKTICKLVLIELYNKQQQKSMFRTNLLESGSLVIMDHIKIYECTQGL